MRDFAGFTDLRRKPQRMPLGPNLNADLVYGRRVGVFPIT